MNLEEHVTNLNKYTAKKEDPWTWMLTPNNHPDHRIEVYHTGHQYDLTLLENTQGNHLKRQEKQEIPLDITQDEFEAKIDGLTSSLRT